MRKVLKNSKDTRSSLETLAEDNRESFQDSRIDFSKNIYPQLDQSLEGLANVSGDLSTTLHSITSMTKQMRDLLDQLKSALHSSSKVLTQTGNVMDQVDQKLQKIVTDLQTLQNSDMYQNILSLEKIDAKDISDFMSSPVNIKTDVLYEVENYGTGMTPFYTNLAIWVGGIVLIAIFKMEVDRDKSMRSYSATNMYFGRWLLYMLLGLVQGLIVCIGDVFLPGVQCRHPFALVLTGLVCSFVYVNIIYALSLTFKHIGKALCVIFVILQIPGSSGTYPIEMTPVFFQKIHPLLPFTYGVAAMREAIAGMYGSVYIHNLLILLCYVPIALLIGLGIRPLLAGLNRLFDLKLSETEFMVCEEPDDQLSRSAQLSMLLRASLSQEDLRTQTAEKAQNFEQNYRKMIRYGFLAIIIIPLIFLILMFSLESKIVFLVLWIISIIAIATWLIIVEFIHTRLAEQQQVAGMSFDEMVKRFRGKEEE